jgi:hypothetical protein
MHVLGKKTGNAGLEPATFSITDIFFRAFQVKQSIGDNAGSILDFCGGEWKYPRDCSVDAKTCDYFARWLFDEDTDKVSIFYTG